MALDTPGLQSKINCHFIILFEFEINHKCFIETGKTVCEVGLTCFQRKCLIGGVDNGISFFFSYVP